MESRLMRNRLFRPNLGLADTEQIFFVFLIDFDFPTIKVSLEYLNHIRSRIGDQQVCGVAIETMAMSVIGQRGNDDQAQGALLSAAAPENRTDGFVTQSMRTAGGKDGGVLPGNGVIFAHLVRSRHIFTVAAPPSTARACSRQSRQLNVFACSSDQDNTLDQLTQHGPIAVAGI